jgi:hypothetical protein
MKTRNSKRITLSERGSRFEVGVDARFLREGVFAAQNIIAVPHTKFLPRLEQIPKWFEVSF